MANKKKYLFFLKIKKVLKELIKIEIELISSFFLDYVQIMHLQLVNFLLLSLLM